MEVKRATRRTLAVDLRNVVVVLILLAITSWLIRRKTDRQLV
jgi:hypothetical protein